MPASESFFEAPLLCLSMLVTSCGGGSNIDLDAASRARVEQAHQKAETRLALAALALAEANAAAEVSQACLVALGLATWHFEMQVEPIRRLGNIQVLFAEGYWPWPEDRWVATALGKSGVSLQGVKEAQVALAEAVEKAKMQAQRSEEAAWDSTEVALGTVEVVRSLSELFETDELRAALKQATAAEEKGPGSRHDRRTGKTRGSECR